MARVRRVGAWGANAALRRATPVVSGRNGDAEHTPDAGRAATILEADRGPGNAPSSAPHPSLCEADRVRSGISPTACGSDDRHDGMSSSAAPIADLETTADSSAPGATRALASNLNALARRGVVELGAGAPPGVQAPSAPALSDDAGAIRHALESARFGERAGSTDTASPVYLAGFASPGLLLACREATAYATGPRPLILVVEERADIARRALSRADLTEAIEDPRVRFFLGPGATARLAAFLRARLDCTIRGPALGASGALSAAVTRAVQRAGEEQQALVASLGAIVAREYADKGPSYWATRFARRTAPRHGLRALVPTHRHSTFVRHSAADIADALRGLGWEVRTPMEPDDWSAMSPVPLLREFAEFRPDLVVSINYPRALLAGVVPANVPFVCWAQDAMGHLFDRRVGQAQGPLDFLAGHTPAALFEQFGYPRARAARTPVLASERKFHTAAVPVARRARFECEVAYVGHQSESPERLHERLRGQLALDPVVARAIDTLRPRVAAIAAAPHEGVTHGPHGALEAAARDALRDSVGAEPEARAVTALLTHYALPLADRLLRHESLAWAAAIADRRAWRFRLYGRGWEAHPTLGAFAAGELEHGDDLRDAYACAGAHLHVSINSSMHQRVLECALSGGLPLCRLHADDLVATQIWMYAALHERPPDLCRLEPRAEGWWAADHPEAMAYTALRQRLGLPVGAIVHSNEHVRAAVRAERSTGPEGLASWLLGDLAELTFRTPEELEGALTRAVERPAWSEHASAGIRARVLGSLTYSAFLPRLLDSVSDSLRDGAGPRDTPGTR